MKKIAIVGGLVALLASSAAMAAGWSQWSTIASIELDGVSSGSPGTYLTFDSSVSTNKPTACASNPLAHLVGSADTVKAMTSLVTASFLAGKSIRVYWNGSCTNSAYAQIAHIEIKH